MIFIFRFLIPHKYLLSIIIIIIVQLYYSLTMKKGKFQGMSQKAFGKNQ